MAAKHAKQLFVCHHCEYQNAKWLGRCPECGTWDSMERRDPAVATARAADSGSRAVPLPEIRTEGPERTTTGLSELDRVLGGGLVAGGATLIGGEPGIGKSTLLLQVAEYLARHSGEVLYATGEESAAQLRLRSDRLGLDAPRLMVLAETDVDQILARCRELRPAAIIVDSIQAVRCAELGSIPGSVSQVRESANRFVDYAKTHGTPTLLVGHVTKDGTIAGPRTLEHLVDAVILFEGDRHRWHRVLRASKNRFGPTDELGVFRMTERGLEEVANPSEIFLAERPIGAPGSAIMAAVEGSRPLLVEIQALVGEPIAGSPRRSALGVDSNRVAMVLTVLQRRAGLHLANRDLFVNVTGGLNVSEPAADLAIAAAAASCLVDKPLPDRWIVFGELGLSGEVRSVSRLEQRIREAHRLGFEAAVVPGRDAPTEAPAGMKLHPVSRVAAALELLLGLGA